MPALVRRTGCDGTLWSLALCLFISALAIAGCDTESAAGSGSSPPAVAIQSETHAATRGPAESVEDAAFSIRISGPEALTVGETGEYTVSLKSGGGYKVNEEYPHKFRVAVGSGLSSASALVRKPQATIEKSIARFPVKVAGKTPGRTSVGGELAFSVCTDEKCLIERRELVFPVEVK